jgi:hypothetical protein
LLQQLLSLVIILAGTCDLGYFQASPIVKSIIGLHQVCHDEGIPHTIVIGIPPSRIQQKTAKSERNTAIQVNQKLKEFCESEPRATAVPFPFKYNSNKAQSRSNSEEK